MTNLFQMDTVKYICCCGSLKPITLTYFCRHCLRLRCSYCVSHEVDSHFCPNCSENMPSAEAKVKKNRCNTCFDCPSCKQTLSIRATTLQNPEEPNPDPANAKKVYYLACGFCRWTSREAGIEDASASGGPWKQPEIEAGHHIDQLVDYFRTLAINEKTAKERKYISKSKFLAAGRHGVAHLLPKRIPLVTPEEMAKPIDPPPYTAPTVGIEDLPELPDDFYSEELILPKITSAAVRLRQIETQAKLYSELLPTHKHLMIKRSLRCRVCERNISKPEYSPASIKFKIQLNAYYHVPQLRLLAPVAGIENVKPGDTIRISLRLSNPTQFPTSLKFLPFSYQKINKEDILCAAGEEGQLSSLGARDLSLDLPFTPQTQMIKEISVLPYRNENFNINFKLVEPYRELVLPPKDESSDFDDFSETQKDFNDDPNFVFWRKANKANVYLDIVRVGEHVEGNIIPPLLGFTIEYDYTNTIMALESKSTNSPQKVKIQAHLLIALDRVPE